MSCIEFQRTFFLVNESEDELGPARWTLQQRIACKCAFVIGAVELGKSGRDLPRYGRARGLVKEQID